MELSLYSWNGITINDGTIFRAYIPPGQMANLSTNPVNVPRSSNFPYLSTTVPTQHVFVIGIHILPGQVIATKRELIKQYFNILDRQRHNLIAKDTLDSDRQWYLTGFPVRIAPDPQAPKNGFMITLATEMPVWRLVTATTDTWNITATGQTSAVTNIGNTYVPPSFAITPTTTKSAGLSYRRWVCMYNNLDVSFNEPFDVTNAGLDINDIITVTSIYNQVNQGGGISAVATSWPIDNSFGGGLPVTGGMFIMGSEQCSYTSIAGGSILGVTRGIGGTTAAIHGDNQVMYFSKMLANHNDLRVWQDGAEVDYWIPSIGLSKIWINPNLSPRHEGTLRTSLPNNGTAVTVAFAQTAANRATLEWMKRAKNPVFLIESEAFVYSPANVNITLYQITSCSRAQKGTSFAAHTAGVTIRHIEHDTWILYGDSTLAAPDVNDDNKPMFDLTSTNTSWSYTYLYQLNKSRPASWRGEVAATKSGLSYLFTGDKNAFADPAEHMGMAEIGSASGYNMTNETAALSWILSHTGGITGIEFYGSKYTVNSWPEVAGIQRLQENTAWITADNQAVPGVIYSWEDFGPVTVSFSSPYPKTIRFAMDGSLAPGSGEMALAQFDYPVVTTDSTYLPTVTIGSEASINFFDFTLTNNTSTEYIKVKTPCPINTALTVDCESKKAYLSDGSFVPVTLSSSRDAWLDLSAGSNTLQFDDTGTAAVTIVTTHRDRNF